MNINKRAILQLFIGTFVSSKSFSQISESKPVDPLFEFHKRLKEVPALRIMHDLKLRKEILSIEILTRCVIAGTSNQTKISDGIPRQSTEKYILGKTLRWSDKWNDGIENKSAEFILKVILDLNTWMVEFKKDEVIIHRYRW